MNQIIVLEHPLTGGEGGRRGSVMSPERGPKHNCTFLLGERARQARTRAQAQLKNLLIAIFILLKGVPNLGGCMASLQHYCIN